MARKSGSFVDALRTVGVLGAFLIASFFVGKFFTVQPDRPTSTIELDDAVTGARAMAKFDVIAPAELPAGAVATSARFKPSLWHLGVLTKNDRYLGLEQAPVKTATLVHDHAPDSRAAGSVELAGRPWSVRTESDGDRIYVRDFGATAVLVISSAGKTVTEDYVSSLVIP